MKKDCRKFKELHKLKELRRRIGGPLPRFKARWKRESSLQQRAGTQTVTVEETKEEKGVPPAYDPDLLMAHINKMKLEDRDSFLDRLLVNDTEDF